VVGGGASYSQNGDNNLLMHTVDVQYENGPIGAYAAYYGVYSDQDAAGSLYDAGIELQASYLLNDKWEVFGRYELINVDEGHGAGDDNYHVIAAGVNYYLHQHAAKFTLDLSYLPNGAPVSFDGGGFLDPDADTDQLVLRAQFQLLL
jgi:predicted porin